MNRKLLITCSLVRKEFQVACRDRAMLVFSGIVVFMLLLSGVLGVLHYQQEAQRRSESNKKFSTELSRFHADAHDVAHYGTYLFKPLNPLSVIDPGLNDYFGSSYRVEAHVQHEVDYSNAEGTDAQLRFGQLTLTLILQLLLPFMYLMICCTMMTQEREQGTFKMLLTQGVSLSKLMWSKIVAYYLFALAWLFPLFMILLMLLGLSEPGCVMIGRYMLLMLGYLLFYFSLTLIGALISLYSRSSRSAMQMALAVWLVGAVVLPKIGSTMVDQHDLLPSRGEFNNQVRQGYLKGIQGDGDSRSRVAHYLEQVRRQYGVQKLEELPLNVDALVLQYNEDYQQKVFDHYYAKVEETFGRQQHRLSFIGFFDPFNALKRWSMALSGTDFFHHQQFFRQAKAYRNAFIRRLNNEMAQKPEKQDPQVAPEPSLVALLPDFYYSLPRLSVVLQQESMSISALLLWPALLTILLYIRLKLIKH
ncbi:MAG: hypothetical protein K0R59_82 [Sphingobacterium sp.]|nr:hypothetical protein [Sphingobacterium sp.]